MIIHSSLPSAGFLTGNAKTHPAVTRQDRPSNSDDNRNGAESGVARQQFPTVVDTEQAERFRSERIDLRVLRSEAESLHRQRAVAAYQVTAGITDSDASSIQTLGLDLFV